MAAIKLLEEEIEKNSRVDFAKYATIISGAHGRWDSFWILDIMEQDLRQHVIQKFEKESASEFRDYIMNLLDEIADAKERDIPPGSMKGQDLALKFWNMIEDFTDGKPDLLESMLKMSDKMESAADEFSKKWRPLEPFVSEALEVYFEAHPDKAPQQAEVDKYD